MSNIEVVGLGALNIDHIHKVERIHDDGEAVVKDVESFPGGSAANTIYGLGKLGVRTGFVGIVGEDAEGQLLLRDFKRVNVDTSQIWTKRRGKTGSVIGFADIEGRRSLYVLPGANSELAMKHLSEKYINRAGMLHVSSFADDSQLNLLLEFISGLDDSTKFSFAPGELYAAKGLNTLAPILRRTYVLFINYNEMKRLTGKEITDGGKACLELGCHIVVVTLGRGVSLEPTDEARHRIASAVCFVSGTEDSYIIEPVRVETVSEPETTGAGDAFATGFLYGLLKEKGFEECGRLGDIVAQFCITKAGGRAGLPTLRELASRYRELYNEEL